MYDLSAARRDDKMSRRYKSKPPAWDARGDNWLWPTSFDRAWLKRVANAKRRRRDRKEAES